MREQGCERCVCQGAVGPAGDVFALTQAIVKERQQQASRKALPPAAPDALLALPVPGRPHLFLLRLLLFLLLLLPPQLLLPLLLQEPTVGEMAGGRR